MNRKKFSTSIQDYEQYMIVTFLNLFFVFLSMYMYWYFRIAYLMYIPTIIFMFEIRKNIEKTRNVYLYSILTFGTILCLTIKYLVQIYFIYGGF